jgi:hypothetical protein
VSSKANPPSDGWEGDPPERRADKPAKYGDATDHNDVYREVDIEVPEPANALPGIGDVFFVHFGHLCSPRATDRAPQSNAKWAIDAARVPFHPVFRGHVAPGVQRKRQVDASDRAERPGACRRPVSG